MDSIWYWCLRNWYNSHSISNFITGWTYTNSKKKCRYSSVNRYQLTNEFLYTVSQKLHHRVFVIASSNIYRFFLLLARYVPNVAKEECMRTMYNIEDQRPTDRPTRRPTDLAFWKISNGHISATGRPIHFMFGSRVGFSGTVDRMDLLPVYQIQDSAARLLG